MPRLLVIALAISMVLTVFGGVAAAEDYAREELSRSESGISWYSDELDPNVEERAEVEVQLRDSYRDPIDDDVFFYVESNRDAEDMSLYYDEEGEYELSSLDDNVWIVETDRRGSNFDGEYMPFWVESTLRGDIELKIGMSRDGNEVREVFRGSRYGAEITMEVLELEGEYYETHVPDEPTKAGDSYTIEALIKEDNGDDPGDRVEGVEVTFYERRLGTESWEVIGSDNTTSGGWAEINVSNDKAAGYEYTVSTSMIDRGYDTGIVSVAAAEPSDIEALRDETNIDEGTERIYFRMTDTYGNINKDIEHGVVNFEDYAEEELEDFDYTERLEVTAINPAGEDIVYEYDDIGYSDKHNVMYADVDFDMLGEWEVEGRITGTTITASTVVNVKEFGTIQDMELELDNPVMRNFADGPGDYNFDHYGEQELTVILIDENDVWIEYDFEGGDIRFSSSDESVARVSTWGGNINPRRTGEVEISAVHQEKDIETAKTLYLSGEPESIDAEVDITPGELTGEVTLTMLDEDGLRAKPGEFETYTENGMVYVDEFVEVSGYELSLPDGLTVEEAWDFEDGETTFTVEADDYGDYQFSVYTNIDLTKDIDLNFIVDEKRTIEMTIDSTTALVDGVEEELEVAPEIRDNRTFLPFRLVGELLGVDVVWGGDQQRVDGEYEGTGVIFFVGEDTGYIDEEPHRLDAVPYIAEDRAMIPFRFFAEAFGADVEWDGEERKVFVEM